MHSHDIYDSTGVPNLICSPFLARSTIFMHGCAECSALPNLLGAAFSPGRCVFSWALYFWATLLGTVNFLGATYSPGHCVFHSALPKFASFEFLAETKFAQRYTRMALPIGTWNQGVRIHYSFRWLMMWRMAEIVVGSMITTYHLYRTLGMQEEAHQ
jgi:hypothetical protein